MDYLTERYGKIRASEIEACRQALAKPIEVERPIIIYIQQVENTIQFAQNGKMPFALENH